jgi:hypothetical protein
MTIIVADTLSSDDTATLLRAKLGPLRAWRDFLGDCNRGRASIKGLCLMPCCSQFHKGLFRPRYATSDVDDFVTKVLEAVPAAGRTPFQKLTVSIDRSKAWWLNRFDSAGTPIPA